MHSTGLLDLHRLHTSRTGQHSQEDPQIVETILVQLSRDRERAAVVLLVYKHFNY